MLNDIVSELCECELATAPRKTSEWSASVRVAMGSTATRSTHITSSGCTASKREGR